MVNDGLEVFLVFSILSVLGIGSLLVRDFVLRLSQRGWRELERLKSRTIWLAEVFLVGALITMFVSDVGLVLLAFPTILVLAALFLQRTGMGGLARDQSWCLHYLGLTARAGLPLHQALRGIAEDIRGRFGIALLGAAERVELGGRLSEALRMNGVFPPHVIAAIQVAEGGGGRMLAATFQSLKAERQWVAEIQGRLSHRMLLPLGSLCFTICGASFLYVFIVPKHQEIMKALRIGGGMLAYIPTLSYFLLLLAMLALAAIAVYVVFTSSAPSRFNERVTGFLTSVFGWASMWSTSFHDRALMRSLRALSVQLDCEVPAPEALRNVGCVEISERFAAEYQNAATLLERGEGFSDALRKSGFPESLCAMLACARNTEQITLALRSEADWYQRRVQRFDRIITVLIPVSLVLLVGIVQFGLIWATFEPINAVRMELLKR